MRASVMLIAVVLLVGCAGDGVESVSPEPTAVTTSIPVASPTPSASPSPTVMPTYPSDLPTESAEEAAIIAGWQEYWRVYAKFTADPNGYTDFSEVSYVTTDERGRILLNFLTYMRENDLKTLGGQVFRDVRVKRVDKGIAEVQYCFDTRHVDVRHADTGEVFERDVADTYVETATMHEGADGIWRVARIHDKEAKC
ncbi:hypothetical protein [Tessaracoccus palaemonis]|uniref:SnoaL-like domain-containing protein n=1 Tax=Tessaracoccus palaemonis TaxID=2829499 RepID=A0ABX8SM65_9ACTN|nr:hypothetical protein [Tessaracoccus palaemonis]QXT63512.1 hypothetical protein KDB89_03270 [Tessaracoccus palaemonis]